jgi:hypothetical protein
MVGKSDKVMLKTVTCPTCGRTVQIGPNSQAWCSQYPKPDTAVGQGYGRKHEQQEMK